MSIEEIANPYPAEGHPDTVIVNTEMDEVRRTDCLCVNCGSGYKGTKECPAGPEFFEVCKKYDNAFAMTRCGVTDSEGKLLYTPLG